MAKFTLKKCKCGRTYKQFKFLDWFDGFFDPNKFDGCGKCLSQTKGK